MIMGEEDLGGARVSVAWQGGAIDLGDASLERAAVYASVLARTLTAVGYQARHLSVGVRREAPSGVLHLTIRGDVPGISESDFENLARATLNGLSARLGLSRDGDVVLVARLDPFVSVESPPVESPPPALPQPARTERDWPFIGRVAIGVVLGLTLGVLGLPRLELSLPSLPGTQPTAVPTSVVVAPPVAQQAFPTPQPLPTPEQLPTPVHLVTATAAPPAPTPTVMTSRVVLEQRFDTQPANWPNDPTGTAWSANGEYRLFARDPGRFVALGVPLPNVIRDSIVSGQFRKVGGPAGGGYGFIIRDQGCTPDRDGRNQSGQYLVFEVGDRGDVGVWHRDQTRWIDVVPWTHSEAVHVDHAPNTLAVTNSGSQLRFEVNGVLVANLSYDRLPPMGSVGLFAGGDLNEVALAWLRIETF
jgi:hypothetical protein